MPVSESTAPILYGAFAAVRPAGAGRRRASRRRNPRRARPASATAVTQQRASRPRESGHAVESSSSCVVAAPQRHASGRAEQRCGTDILAAARARRGRDGALARRPAYLASTHLPPLTLYMTRSFSVMPLWSVAENVNVPPMPTNPDVFSISSRSCCRREPLGKPLHRLDREVQRVVRVPGERARRGAVLLRVAVDEVVATLYASVSAPYASGTRILPAANVKPSAAAPAPSMNSLRALPCVPYSGIVDAELLSALDDGRRLLAGVHEQDRVGIGALIFVSCAVMSVSPGLNVSSATARDAELRACSPCATVDAVLAERRSSRRAGRPS